MVLYDHQGDRDLVIGHDGSTTRIPNHVTLSHEGTELTLYDSPGFEDTGAAPDHQSSGQMVSHNYSRIAQEIFNGRVIQSLMTNCEAKIVFIMEETSIAGRGATAYAVLLNKMMRMFPNLGVDNVMLVVSKASPDFDEEGMKTLLGDFITKYLKDSTLLKLQILLRDILTRRHYGWFFSPEYDRTTSRYVTIDETGVRKNILDKIRGLHYFTAQTSGIAFSKEVEIGLYGTFVSFCDGKIAVKIDQVKDMDLTSATRIQLRETYESLKLPVLQKFLLTPKHSNDILIDFIGWFYEKVVEERILNHKETLDNQRRIVLGQLLKRVKENIKASVKVVCDKLITILDQPIFTMEDYQSLESLLNFYTWSKDCFLISQAELLKFLQAEIKDDSVASVLEGFVASHYTQGLIEQAKRILHQHLTMAKFRVAKAYHYGIGITQVDHSLALRLYRESVVPESLDAERSLTSLSEPACALLKSDKFDLSCDMRLHLTYVELQELEVQELEIQELEVQALAGILTELSKDLVELLIVNIGPRGFVTLTPVMGGLSRVTVLDLSKNDMGDGGATNLGLFIGGLRNLRKLTLSYNSIGDKGITDLDQE